MARTAIRALLLLALLPAAAAAGDLVESIPVRGEGTLRIDLDRGRVEIASHDRPEVRIEARARGLGASSVHFALAEDARGVLLRGRGEAWLAYLSAGPRVAVRAWVPSRYAVEVLPVRTGTLFTSCASGRTCGDDAPDAVAPQKVNK